MRRIAAIVSSLLFIVFFRSSFGGTSVGHQVRIVVYRCPEPIVTTVGSRSNQTQFDLLNDPIQIDTDKYTASLGFEKCNVHHKWMHPSRILEKASFQSKRIEEIKEILPNLFIDHARFEFTSQSAPMNEKLPLIYCTVTDVI